MGEAGEAGEGEKGEEGEEGEGARSVACEGKEAGGMRGEEEEGGEEGSVAWGRAGRAWSTVGALAFQRARRGACRGLCYFDRADSSGVTAGRQASGAWGAREPDEASTA